MGFGETFLAILIGFGLSVACGFRLFIPLLVVGSAAYTGELELPEGFTWLGERPVLKVFSFVLVCEIISYEIPVISSVLDIIETPLVFVAGTILSALMLTDMDPLLQWGLAAIVGGGSAALVHVGTAVLRNGLLVSTAGVGSSLLSIAEDAVSVTLAILSILLTGADWALVLEAFWAFILEAVWEIVLEEGGSALFFFVLLVSVLVLLVFIVFAIKKWIVRRRQMSA